MAATINSDATSPEEATKIGKGAGQITWVVDPENHAILTPVGCVGELLLEGPLISPGYLNDSEKTAAAFIDDPVWLLRGTPHRPGRQGRLYKTGDLVRYNQDGVLSFVGRKNTRVKIRGQRVELGEVEYRVQECLPIAKQVVAETIVPREGESSLVLAVFVQLPNSAVGGDKLQTDGPDSTMCSTFHITHDVEGKLAAHLPSYMMPTHFFSVREFPLTITGKTDRGRLREIGRSFSIRQPAVMRT
jgi:acyl-CoA synthetase (AMP-forming)/AMP-acid ligase II